MVSAFLDEHPYLLPLYFVLIWLGATGLIAILSGWLRLQRTHRDDEREKPLVSLERRSANLLHLVRYGRVVRLRAYESGFGIAVWFVSGPFQDHLKIPWTEVRAKPDTVMFIPAVRVDLGHRPAMTIHVSYVTWHELTDGLPSSIRPALDESVQTYPNRASFVRGLILSGSTLSAFTGLMLALAPFLEGHNRPFPWDTWASITAAIAAIQLFRYARSN